jgi:NAD(P)H-flavin reductase
VQSFYQDEVGLIDINQIFEESAKESNYFISGPPVMIKSFKKSLVDKGTLAVNVLTDDWE